MKIIYIGSSAPLSLIPLKTLINSSHEVSAIAFEQDSNCDFNVISPDTIHSLAFSNSIPVIKLYKEHANTIALIKAYQPDIILVSCFARKLPNSILDLARVGSFNLHPSLLPLFRGPNPLFWQFRQGINNYGITLHRMSDEFDTGNIISQREVKLIDGMSKDDATELLAYAASNLILDTLKEIKNNKVSETKQDEVIATYQSFPTESDYKVSTSWKAKRIYNFINAYKSNSVSFICNVYGKTFRLINAKSFQEIPYPNMHGQLSMFKNKVITFACKDGFIECEAKS